MQTCTCPASTALTTIAAEGCPVNFGQIQKVAFMRLKDADGVANEFTTANVVKKTTWTAAMTATDGGKVVLSPYIYGPTDGGGDPITFGSGNDALGGVAEVIGSNPVTFSGQHRHVDQSIIATEKELICEARANNLGVFLFDENGAIEGIKTATGLAPIPIRSLFVGDKLHGGYDAYDYNVISWSYLPNYSDNLEIVIPEFNPLTDLQ